MSRYYFRFVFAPAIAAILLFLTVLLACAGTMPMAPDQVTLFPDRALLEVKETIAQSVLPGGQRGVVLTLPPQADPATLRISPAAGTLADVSWELAPAVDQGTVEAMRKELDGLYRAQAGLSGALQATEARIALWTEVPLTNAAAAELERLDAAMDKHLQALNNEKFDITQRGKALDETIKTLEDRINRAVGGDNSVWQVHAVFADAPASVAVRYSYVLGGCRWEPLYRFEALAGQKKVAFAFDAAIEQSSGMDWSKAQLRLATVERNISLVPPQLPVWLVEQLQVVAYADAVGMESAPENAAPMLKMSRAAAPAPRKVEQGTYALWDIGERSVPAGRRIILPVKSETWGTSFVYTVRPSRDEKAYLTAHLNLPEAQELPQGMAMFLVDGALIGKRVFSLSGTEVELFFGADPLVTATQRLLEKQSGNKGVIGRKQTMVWAWEMVLKNDRNHPVLVHTEEPQPQSDHEDIRIETASTPQPRVTDKHVLVWETELAPRSLSTISHVVTVTAPKDMLINFGRGR